MQMVQSEEKIGFYDLQFENGSQKGNISLNSLL